MLIMKKNNIPTGFQSSRSKEKQQDDKKFNIFLFRVLSYENNIIQVINIGEIQNKILE